MPDPKNVSPIWRAAGSVALLLIVIGTAYGLYLWKGAQRQAAATAAASMPEPAEAVESATVTTRRHTRTTTSIGTVRALRSITLRNETSGTVRRVQMKTGSTVAAGALLVELDVAVEKAQLAALQAEARLAESMFTRIQKASKSQGASAADVDRAKAESDMAAAHVKRLEAIIEQKRLRAPFPARVGFVDLNIGQYLQPGTLITTLQGIDDAVHIDFEVTQDVATRLAPGVVIQVVTAPGAPPVDAKIIAIDARVNANTRSTSIRAELRGSKPQLQPGASVRVRAPVTATRDVTVVPVSALRRGPGGNSVFLLKPDPQGKLRSHVQRVESGTVLGDDVIIESGLSVGDQVATTGSFKLREGALVHLPKRPLKQD